MTLFKRLGLLQSSDIVYLQRNSSYDGEDSSQQYWATESGDVISSVNIVPRPFVPYMQSLQPLVPDYSAYSVRRPLGCSPGRSLTTRTDPQYQELVVPQRPYAANIQRNYTRSIPMIPFIVNGHSGISLLDALSHNFRGLAQAEDRLLQGFGVKITYRIEVSIDLRG